MTFKIIIHIHIHVHIHCTHVHAIVVLQDFLSAILSQFLFVLLTLSRFDKLFGINLYFCGPNKVCSNELVTNGLHVYVTMYCSYCNFVVSAACNALVHFIGCTLQW